MLLFDSVVAATARVPDGLQRLLGIRIDIELYVRRVETKRSDERILTTHTRSLLRRFQLRKAPGDA